MAFIAPKHEGACARGLRAINAMQSKLTRECDTIATQSLDKYANGLPQLKEVPG